MTENTETKPLILEPLGNRIIVKEDDFIYKGSILIPETAKRRTSTGHILMVSKEALTDLQVGDRILFAQFSGTGVNFQNQPAYRILSVDEVIAKITVEDAVLEGTSA